MALLLLVNATTIIVYDMRAKNAYVPFSTSMGQKYKTLIKPHKFPFPKAKMQQSKTKTENRETQNPPKNMYLCTMLVKFNLV